MNTSLSSIMSALDLDYYGILNCDQSCTIDDIKTSYYKLARLYHPDRLQGLCATMNIDNNNNSNSNQNNNINSSNDKNYSFHIIHEAYTILSNNDLRNEYNKYLMIFQTNGQQPNIGYNAENIHINEFEILQSSSNFNNSNNNQTFLVNEDDDVVTVVTYTKPCRCGEYYYINSIELNEGYRLIQCSGCSLYINITVLQDTTTNIAQDN